MFEESRVVQGVQIGGGVKRLQLDVATVVYRGLQGCSEEDDLDELRGKLGQSDSTLLKNNRLLAVVLTEGLTPAEQEQEEAERGQGWAKKREREEPFPLDLLWNAFDLDVREAQASWPIDKVHILNTICKADQLEGEPDMGNPELEKVNIELRAAFAQAALPSAAPDVGLWLGRKDKKRAFGSNRKRKTAP